MRTIPIIAAGLLLGLSLGGSTLAGPDIYGSTTSQCIDVGGRSRPAVCRKSASLLPTQDDICICRFGQQVTVPYCPAGVRPPAETRDFERVRFRLSRDGSLVGDAYRGREICVRR